MAKPRSTFECSACGHRAARWSGRCSSCDGWGTVEEVVLRSQGPSAPPPDPVALGSIPSAGPTARISTGWPGVDRVLGGGLVAGSVVLLAGEPGIGKSTLLLHLLSHVASTGLATLLASGEESHGQVAGRASRLMLDPSGISFAPGRALDEVLEATRTTRPTVLAVDSIQTIRHTDGQQMPGGVAQVRICTDSLVGLAKADGATVIMTGHVTKDGDLAGPRALEHAVDVVLTFDGDPRSGLRVLTAGKNRFGAEGESAWFEMGADGLTEIDPTDLLRSHDPAPGAAVALPRSGRRALAVEIQALVGASDGPARRQTTGLDARRFQLVAAVLERGAGLAFGRAELYGAASGGMRIDDPACDLAVAAALTSAATGVAPPQASAFVGEVALTGAVRPSPSMDQRIAAAASAGCTTVFCAAGAAGATDMVEGVRLVPVRHIGEALTWADRDGGRLPDRRTA